MGNKTTSRGRGNHHDKPQQNPSPRKIPLLPSISRFHFLLVFQSATHSLCTLRGREESDCEGWDQLSEICHESVSFISCHTTHRWLHVLGCEGGVTLGPPQLLFLYACVLSMNQCWSKSKRHYLRETTDNINTGHDRPLRRKSAVSTSYLYVIPVILEYLQYVFDMIHRNVLDVTSPVPVLGNCKHCGSAVFLNTEIK